MSVQCKKPPFTNTMFIDRSKFKNNSEKGYSMNISMRLLQNLTNTFREDFLRTCLYSYSLVAPIHQNHVHGQVKISLTIFEKGYSRNNSATWELEAIYSVVLIDLVLFLNEMINPKLLVEFYNL